MAKKGAESEDYYTRKEVNELLAQQRAALMEYVNKQIKMGNLTPNPDETSLYMEVEKTDL